MLKIIIQQNQIQYSEKKSEYDILHRSLELEKDKVLYGEIKMRYSRWSM